jgi:hypothetical protein
MFEQYTTDFKGESVTINVKKENTIQEAVYQVLKEEKIKTKEELDAWCGEEKRKKLYNRVQSLSETHWRKLKIPEKRVMTEYQTLLVGYKLYKGP